MTTGSPRAHRPICSPTSVNARTSGALRGAGHVRRDEGAGGSPQRVLGREGLGVGDVEGRRQLSCSRGARAGHRCRRRGHGRRSRARPAPAGSSESTWPSTSPRVSRVSGSSTTSTFDRGSSWKQLRHGVNSRPGVAGDADQVDLERFESRLQRRADRSVAEDRHRRPRQLLGLLGAPLLVLALAVAQLGEPALWRRGSPPPSTRRPARPVSRGRRRG